MPELVEVDELEVTPPVEVETPPVLVETPPVELETPPVLVETPPVELLTPPVEVETPPVEVVEVTPPVLVETPPVVVELPPLDVEVEPPDVEEELPPVDVELPPVEVELAIPPVVVLVTTTEPPPLLDPPKKPPKKPPPKPKPPPAADHHGLTAAAAFGHRLLRQLGQHRHGRYGHLRSLLASGGAGHDAADLALLDRTGLGHLAHGYLALHHLGLGGLRGTLGVLDILRLGSRRLGHMDRTTADNRAAGSKHRDFRKGHPNRHKLCSLLHFSKASNPAAPRHMHAPIESKGQRKVKATIALTVFWPSRCGKYADRECVAGCLSHNGTEPTPYANLRRPIMVTCQTDRENRTARPSCPTAG